MSEEKISFIDVYSYFIKNSYDLGNYLNEIYIQISNENKLHKIDFGRYLNLSTFFYNRLFSIFNINKFLELDEFITIMKKIYSKNYEEAIKFCFNIYDLSNDGLLYKRNIQIVLFNIVDSSDQNILFPKIKFFLSLFFCKDKLTYEEFKYKIENENSDLFYIIINFFYQNKPFSCKSVDYFSTKSELYYDTAKLKLPSSFCSYFIKEYFKLVKYINQKKREEEDDEYFILDDKTSINFIPNIVNKNAFIRNIQILPKRKDQKSKTVINDYFKGIFLSENEDVKVSDLNSTIDNTYTEDVFENIMYINNNFTISQYKISLLHKNLLILQPNSCKMFIYLFKSYIINKKPEARCINRQKYYSFIIFNNGRFIECLTNTYDECSNWIKKINRTLEFRCFEDYYKISEKISETKSTSVNIAENIHSKEKVIVKVLYKFNLNYLEYELFLNELDIIKKCNNPYIVKYIDSFEDKDYLYIVMEKLDISLYNFIKNGLLQRKQIYYLIFQIIKGIRYINKLGIIHRDIKLDNICLLNDNIKIIDFGLSTFIGVNEKLNLKCGTTSYMSPEMLIENSYDSKTDVWSLGMVIFRIIHMFQGLINKDFESNLENQISLLIYNKSSFVMVDIWDRKYDDLKEIVLKCVCKYSDRISLKELYRHPNFAHLHDL